MPKLNIELTPEVLELAAGVRDRFPGLTDPEIAVELLKLGLEKNAKASVSMQEARTTLAKMLLALSGEALEYVWRPIIYAYYYSDGRDPDRLNQKVRRHFALKPLDELQGHLTAAEYEQVIQQVDFCKKQTGIQQIRDVYSPARRKGRFFKKLT